MRVHHRMFVGIASAVLMGSALVGGTAALAAVRCPAGYKCIPTDTRYQGFYRSEQPAPQASAQPTADNYIKPESGLSHPNGPGW